MMKCEHCGSPLTIEQERCGFCGQPNPNFRQHREDMKQYSADFQQTKSHVYRQTKQFTRVTVPLTAIVILFVLNILVYGAIGFSWEFSSWIIESRIHEEKDIHIAQLEQLLAEEDYLGFHSYFNNHDLYLSDDFDSYQALDNAASSFDSIWRWLNYYQCDDYYTREETAKYLADSLGYLYDAHEGFGADSFREDDPAHLPLIENMIDKSHVLISSALELPLDTVETFPDLSAAKRQEVMKGGASDAK